MSWADAGGPARFWTGPGRQAQFSYDGPRPGPVRQIFRGWAAARPGPSIFQRMGHGPAQPITFSNVHGPSRPGRSFFISISARPGPAHHLAARAMGHGLCMGRHDNYVGRPLCFLVLKGACAYADVFFLRYLFVFRCFFPV